MEMWAIINAYDHSGIRGIPHSCRNCQKMRNIKIDLSKIRNFIFNLDKNQDQFFQ